MDDNQNLLDDNTIDEVSHYFLNIIPIGQNIG